MRIFTAFIPPLSIQNRLASLAVNLAVLSGGRAVLKQNIHMTVLFIGEISKMSLAGFCLELKQFPPPVMTLTLDKVIKVKSMLWLVPSNPPDEVFTFYRQLQRLYPVPDNHDFSPHVTMARKVRKAVKYGIKPIKWRIDGLTVVRSVLQSSGAVYENIEFINKI